MKFEELYKSTFDQVVASPETVREVLNMKNNNKKKIRIPALAAAVLLICALATTAFAYTGYVVYENPKQMLNAFFGVVGNKSAEGEIVANEYGGTIVNPAFQREELDEKAAQKYVAPYAYAVGQSVSAGDNTLTVDGYVYDANIQCGVIYVSLEMEQGVPEYRVASSGELMEGLSLVRDPFGMYFFVDEANSSDTKVTMAGYFYVPDYYEESSFPLYLSSGQGKNDPHINIPLENTGELQCITAGDGGIQVGPFGVVVHGDRLGILKENTKETNNTYVAIRYADGTEYVILDETGDVPVMNYARANMERGDRNDGYVTDRYCVTYQLNRIVDLEEVTEVVVDGVTYSVD